jgi:uncharacterized protein (DUF433 family)
MSPSNSIIVKDPDILGGTPVFRGTRVPVRRFSTPSKVAKRSRSSWKDFLL